LSKSFLSVKVGPPNNYRAAFVGRFDNNIFAFTKTFECCPFFCRKVRDLPTFSRDRPTFTDKKLFGNFPTPLFMPTQLINPKFCVSRPDRRSTTVSLETNPPTNKHCDKGPKPIRSSTRFQQLNFLTKARSQSEN